MGKAILALLMFLGGIALGLYVGIWVMFVGGIIGLVEAGAIILNGGAVEALSIGWSIVKIMLSGLVGYISAIALIIPAMAIAKDL